jgi:hypothetical protein
MGDITKRLAAYSALAATFMVMQPTEAQVVYHDIDPDVVFAITGTLVLHTTCLNTGMLPIAQLPAGAYTIHILGAGNTTYIQSLIKL